ncbi:glutamyl-tRNA(Gln) amidotransferase [Fusarium albosuccineum]|uniref:Glutamyl-tRNA(Gln) amidotransferase n=1 Tax=Fusarium albosuccineum TaxID=1237068 RepID=A0A8H4KY84_9HYPO|nr:glutamyl-tRNA(Gln) amidotransferase [Fusarium albosuccineum]
MVHLGDDEYFVPPDASWKLPSWEVSTHHDEFTPVTVVSLNDTVNAANIAAVLDRFGTTDDVWTAFFAQTLYIQSPGSRAPKGRWWRDLAPDYNISAVFHSDRENPKSIAPGPYFIHSATGSAYRAYKLYPDTSQAFIQSSYQDSSTTHHPLRAAGHSAAGLTVAVPSRLYFAPTNEKPLAGIRISVKDIFDLKGLKTSAGNRAFYGMSKIKTETALSVQKLIDAGAVVIGKNKLSEFAFAGIYVTEHIDYLLPFNPRGDGYNSPNDSSGGSAAAIASYDWLDASIGSDTGGSIRGPAAANGVYGNRPSQGAVNLTGVIPLSPAMDTASILTRDPILWSKITQVLYSGSIKGRRSPYPKSIFLDPSSAQKLADVKEKYLEVVDATENFLKSVSEILSAKVTTFSIDEAWNKSGPAAFKETPISNIVDLVYRNLKFQEQWLTFGKGFVEEYMSLHDGEFPYMTPLTRLGWLTVNATMGEDIHQQDLRYKAGVEQWFSENVLSSDNDTCSNALYIYFTLPSTTYKPDVSKDSSNLYIAELISKVSAQQIETLRLNSTINCNTTLGSEETCQQSLEAIEKATSQPETPVYAGRLASIAGVPDYALTLGSFDLGEVTFSNATLKSQQLPLSVDIMAAKGCDFMLFDLIEDLHKAGAIRQAKTGRIV